MLGRTVTMMKAAMEGRITLLLLAILSIQVVHTRSGEWDCLLFRDLVIGLFTIQEFGEWDCLLFRDLVSGEYLSSRDLVSRLFIIQGFGDRIIYYSGIW